MRLQRVVLGIGLTIVLGVTIDGMAQARGTNDSRLTGLKLYASKKYQEAIRYFDQVLASHKRDREILIKRVACYLVTNQPEKALADFDRVNEYSGWASRVFGAGVDGFGGFAPGSTWIGMPTPDVTFAENWGNRGLALLMLERNEEALQSFRTSTDLWSLPQNQSMIRGRAGAYQGLGQAYHRLGQDELAFQTYSAAISVDATDPNGFAGRGDVLASLKLLGAAEADFNEAIRLDPTHSRAYCGRGIVRSDLGRVEPALADLDRAIALDPKYAKAYSHRGGLHARRGQNELALADYDALIQVLPDNAGAYKDRGGVLVRMNRFDRAVDDLSEAIRLAPKSAAAYQNRGAAYNGLGQYERAIEDLSKAIELKHDNAGAYTNRGLAYFAVGQFDQAVADLSEAITIAPRNAIPYFNRAEVFARLGLRDRAIQDYDATVQLDPRLTAAYAASARLREDKGQRDHAIHDFDMALRLDPNEVNLLYDRANTRRETGDWRGALADYDRAVVLAPQKAETYVARGWSRFCAGVEGADLDARVYLKLKGWRDSFSPYMAILAALAARQAQQPEEAKRVLDEAVANLSPRLWPVPVLRYLQGELTEPALLDLAVSTRQQAEAHTFIGLDRLRSGDRAGAILHLHWARDHGSEGSIALDVAQGTLARL
ncbi:MAG TPA: tetratricopeptide repeat protein, partial [Isosphaeraceae bacterium]|nr:tetratricopeptide repeat protein [Isosphaeraceae bacterium]